MAVPAPTARLRVGIVGAGWAGLAAAVRACQDGHAVTLFEMAPQTGGRARSLSLPASEHHPALALDNGQHILIGAYSATLALMQQVGVDLDQALLRRPLTLVDHQGRGLRLQPGHALLSFPRAVLAQPHWRWRERGALLAASVGWLLRGFACPADWTVDHLCRRLPAQVRRELIDPLCAAALNTAAEDASAAVFLRVLHDALLSGPGSSDLLLPRLPMADLLPTPALAWLAQRGVELRTGQRIQQLLRSSDGAGWRLATRAATEAAPVAAQTPAIDPTAAPSATSDGSHQGFDRVILACSASEAARLARPHAPQWADTAAAIAYEPIITAYFWAPGASLAAPMVACDGLWPAAGWSADSPSGPALPHHAPAQFAFDHAALGAQAGLFSLVASAGSSWTAAGPQALQAALLAQADALLPGTARPRLLRIVNEKRATFRCVPGLARPPRHLATGLQAAGDYVDGPYPATLEGAVRAGLDAAIHL